MTDEDVDAVMRMGGASCKPEITYEELPAALGIAMALKAENFQIKDLFDRHDVDKVCVVWFGAAADKTIFRQRAKQGNMPLLARSLWFLRSNQRANFLLFFVRGVQSGKLPKEQIATLLTEINDGLIPTSSDVDYVVAQCDLSGDGCVDLAQIKAAIACWLCLAEEAALPESVEAAQALGYTDLQIEAYVAAATADAAAAAAMLAGAGAGAALAEPIAVAEPAVPEALLAAEAPAAEAPAAE